MKHLISLKEQSKEDILTLLDMAQRLKKKFKNGDILDILRNRDLIMLFEKTSTRTRLSFEVAMTEMGGHAIYIDKRTSQFSLTDFVDEIRAVMRYGAILMYRARQVKDVETAAKLNSIPVIDACSEKYHPAQALSDLLTMVEHAGGLDKVKRVAWLGIENNVMNTLMLVCTKLGIEFHIACGEVDDSSVDPELSEMAEKTGLVKRFDTAEEAVKGADFVHTDTWMNMEFFDGDKVLPQFESVYQARKKKLIPFQVNAKLIDSICPNAKIMHCMPCHIGYEISRDAVDHKNSIIFDQAENRLDMQKAMILWLLDKDI